MTVTNNYTQKRTRYAQGETPAEEAVRIVGAISEGNPSWKEDYSETFKRHNGQGPFLRRAVEIVCLTKGVELTDDLKSELERLSLGKELRVNGAVVGSAVNGNDSGTYEGFLEEHTGEVGVAQSRSRGNTEVYEIRDKKGKVTGSATQEEAEEMREGLSEGKLSSWLSGF
jgi:hypothetical protein